jgi:hypothetical protein
MFCYLTDRLSNILIFRLLVYSQDSPEGISNELKYEFYWVKFQICFQDAHSLNI